LLQTQKSKEAKLKSRDRQLEKAKQSDLKMHSFPATIKQKGKPTTLNITKTLQRSLTSLSFKVISNCTSKASPSPIFFTHFLLQPSH